MDLFASKTLLNLFFVQRALIPAAANRPANYVKQVITVKRDQKFKSPAAKEPSVLRELGHVRRVLQGTIVL
jgi:hypothetical protein